MSYTVKITDVTGNVQTLRNMERTFWDNACDSAATGTSLSLTYAGAESGLPIQILWGRNSIVRAELIPEK